MKRFALGWAATMTGAARSTLMADISSGANPENVLKLDLGYFPILQDVFGSMRFNLFGSSSAGGIITITRAPGDVFHAVSAFCTHEGCIVDPYDNTPGIEAMICYCHSSIYDIQGHLITGAVENQSDLPSYNTSLDGNTLSVEIPNLNYKLNSITSATPVGGNSRFKLSFPVKLNGRYQVLHTADLATDPVPVNFSNSASGGMTQTQFNSLTTGNKDVWVQNTAARGFYVIRLIVTPWD